MVSPASVVQKSPDAVLGSGAVISVADSAVKRTYGEPCTIVVLPISLSSPSRWSRVTVRVSYALTSAFFAPNAMSISGL